MVHIQSHGILNEQLTRMFVNCKQIQYAFIRENPKLSSQL